MIDIKTADQEKVLFALEEVKKSSYSDQHKMIICENILLAFVGVKGFEDLDDKKILIRKATSRFRQYKKHSLAIFKRAILNEIRAFKKRKIQSFKILFLVNLDKQKFKNKRYFSVNGNRLFLRDISYVRKNFDFKKYLNQLSSIEHSNSFKVSNKISRFLFVECPVQGKSRREAFYNAYNDFELLRAILNLSNSFSTITFQGMGYTPLNVFLPSPIYGIFDEKGKFIDTYYEAVVFKYNLNKLSLHFKPNVYEYLMKQFRVKTAPNSIKEISRHSLIKYVKSLDSVQWNNNFLSLWQVLEMIVFYDEVSTITTTNKRVKLLLGHKRTLNYGMDVVAFLRNQFVHKGNYPDDGLDQVNLLKGVVENIILLLLTSNRLYTNKNELNKYFKYGNISKNELKQDKAVIQRIIRNK